MLYVMGRESEKIFQTFHFGLHTEGEGDNQRQIQERDTDFDTLMKKFDAYFIVKRNIIHERTKFQERKQGDETIEEFYRSLRSLVAHCQYADLEDQVRDRFVVGLKDRKLKEQLQLMPDLTLSKALEVARQNEQVKIQLKEQGEEKEKSTDAVNRDRRRHHNKQWKQEGQDTQKRSQSSGWRGRGRGRAGPAASSSKEQCGRCGLQHAEGHCPARGKICRRCKAKNHYARVCRSVKEVEQETDSEEEEFKLFDLPEVEKQQEQEEDQEQFQVDSVIDDKSKPWIQKLVIKDTVVPFKIDTGADVSIISDQTYRNLKRKPQLKRSNIVLTSPGGRLSVKGEFTAKTVVKQKNFKFRIIVVSSSLNNNLLSRGAAYKMGLIKRVEEVRQDVFGTAGLLNTDPVPIKLTENAVPYCVSTARRVPFPLQNKVKTELDRMKKAGVIREIKEPTDWCAPMVPVVKPNGNVRICVDFKKLNQAVKRPHCMLPNLDDIAPKMAGATVFSTLDATAGFFQVPIAEESKPLTTFITPFGRFCFERVPMGISLGPECFQTKMKEVLDGLEGCDAIMDDTIVYGKTLKEHDQRLDAVLDRIAKSGLKLNKQKCHFRKKEVNFFGHVISAEGIMPDPEKVKAITEMSPPNDLTELRTLCGMMNYLSRFVSNLATILKPVTDLMKKNIQFAWQADQQKAFNLAKEKIAKATSLGFYDPRRQTIVSADSSSFGLGAVILQRDGEKLIPIAFASRTLTDAECRYAQIEKECLASVYACEKFSKYLIGLDKFELQTDHKPLVPLMMTKDLDRAPVRCQRLLMRLMRFNADVKHVPGKNLVIADALSRKPLQHTVADQELKEVVQEYVDAVHDSWPITSNRLDRLRAATIQDRDLQQVIHYVYNGWPAAVPTHLKGFQQAQGELSMVDGLLVYGTRVVIPASQHQEMLEMLHESHQGLHKCRARAQMSLWWPGLSRDLKDYVEKCRECRKHRPVQRNEPLRPTELPERPWQKLGADLLHYDGKDYLVVIDYYSRWLELVRLHSLSSATVIKKFQQIFATHGIPDVLMSDNGTQFQCTEFHNFAKTYDFTQMFSSPVFPQSNGEAEAGVKIAKKILRQPNTEVALLNYRATPHSSTGVSPAKALMGRELKTKLPILAKNLINGPSSDADVRNADAKTKIAYKNSYDRRHGTMPLPPLQTGDPVLIRTDAEPTWQNEGRIITADPQNRTYLVNSPSGVLRRNRKHLQKLPAEQSNPPPETPQKDASMTRIPTTQSNTSPSKQQKNREQHPSPDPPMPPVPNLYITRSAKGYVAQKPFRYREEEMKMKSK